MGVSPWQVVQHNLPHTKGKSLLSQTTFEMFISLLLSSVHPSLRAHSMKVYCIVCNVTWAQSVCTPCLTIWVPCPHGHYSENLSLYIGTFNWPIVSNSLSLGSLWNCPRNMKVANVVRILGWLLSFINGSRWWSPVFCVNRTPLMENGKEDNRLPASYQIILTHLVVTPCKSHDPGKRFIPRVRNDCRRRSGRRPPFSCLSPPLYTRPLCQFKAFLLLEQVTSNSA